jgi:hypothetical protein
MHRRASNNKGVQVIAASRSPKFREFPIHCQEAFPFGEDRATSWTDDLSASKGVGRGQRPREESARDLLPFVFLCCRQSQCDKVQRRKVLHDPITRGTGLDGVSGVGDVDSEAWFIPTSRDDETTSARTPRAQEASPDEEDLEGAAA